MGGRDGGDQGRGNQRDSDILYERREIRAKPADGFLLSHRVVHRPRMDTLVQAETPQVRGADRDEQLPSAGSDGGPPETSGR
jgi:hypothetical protein